MKEIVKIMKEIVKITKLNPECAFKDFEEYIVGKEGYLDNGYFHLTKPEDIDDLENKAMLSNDVGQWLYPPFKYETL